MKNLENSEEYIEVIERPLANLEEVLKCGLYLTLLYQREFIINGKKVEKLLEKINKKVNINIKLLKLFLLL